MLKTNTYFWKYQHNYYNTQCSNIATTTKNAGFIIFVTTLLSIDCFYMKGYSYEQDYAVLTETPAEPQSALVMYFLSSSGIVREVSGSSATMNRNATDQMTPMTPNT